MASKGLKIVFSLLIAALFLWFAFRGVPLSELWNQITEIKLGWIFPFTIVMLLSHYLRAERWMLLLTDLKIKPLRSTMMAGVMLGYMVNYAFPRLGEVSRPVYVARKNGLSSGKLLGTIVLERIIDLVCLIFFLLFISIYFIADEEILSQIFGTEGWTTRVYLFIPTVLALLIFFSWAGFRLLRFIETKWQLDNPFLKKLVEFIDMFWKGIVSVRNVNNWPLYILYTLGIWAGYIMMAYLPFWMLDMHTIYDLGAIEAMVLTIISAVGMAVPTPGGIGSYHLFTQQTLWLIFSVPLVTSLTYATVNHGVTMIMVLLTGPLILWFDKYYTLKNKVVR